MLFRSESTKIINDSVKEISNAAKAKVPIKTGLLKNSIGFSTYKQGVGASVYADTRYAAYVEFGTGDFGFGIPVYSNINMNDLEHYALSFKKNKKLFEGFNIARKEIAIESNQESSLLDEKNIKDI